MLRARPARKPYRVVVGVDFAEISEPALAEAMELVRNRPGAELHLCHVVPERDAARGHRIARDEERIEEAMAKLREFSARGRTYDPEGGVHTKVLHVRLGRPAKALEQLAADVDASLIVVGTLGLHGVEKLVFGSVADELLRLGRAPVLVARRNRLGELPKSSRVDPPPATRSP
jgi:nucleotide-binding universal stress UspA family protein